MNAFKFEFGMWEINFLLETYLLCMCALNGRKEMSATERIDLEKTRVKLFLMNEKI